MKVHNVEQNTPEWLTARLGKPTASSFDKIITPTGKESAQADGYSNKLVAEIIIGKPVETFEGNEHTERGKELEPDAVSLYELKYGIDTVTVGFVTNDDETFGCSPDRLVGEDGLLEIKCPAPHTHVQYLLEGKVDSKYYPQIQGQLLVTGRKWVDWFSYHPELPPVVIRVERDDEYLDKMSSLLTTFTENLSKKLTKLKGA